MDDAAKADSPMTVVEAMEKLEEFKQKLVNEHYDTLMEEGEAETKVGMEIVDALEVLLYYINTLDQLDSQDL